MDPYLILKFVHVAMAILWVGGASILTLLVVILLSRGDDEATMTGVSYVALLGNRVFAPVGLATIASGLTLGWLGGWFWPAWTVLAIAIVACTFVLGAAVLGPTCERSVTTWERRRPRRAAWPSAAGCCGSWRSTSARSGRSSRSWC